MQEIDFILHDLLYKVQNSVYIRNYQTLNAELNRHKEEEDFAKMAEILDDMGTNIENRLKISKMAELKY